MSKSPKEHEVLEIKSFTPAKEGELKDVTTILGNKFFEIQAINKLEYRDLRLVVIYELRETVPTK